MKKILTILIMIILLVSCKSKKENNLKEVSIILDCSLLSLYRY